MRQRRGSTGLLLDVDARCVGRFKCQRRFERERSATRSREAGKRVVQLLPNRIVGTETDATEDSGRTTSWRRELFCCDAEAWGSACPLGFLRARNRASRRQKSRFTASEIAAAAVETECLPARHSI